MSPIRALRMVRRAIEKSSRSAPSLGPAQLLLLLVLRGLGRRLHGSRGNWEHSDSACP